MNKKALVLLVFFYTSGMMCSYAQDMLGLCSSNYAGLNGLKINPANSADSRLKHDINIFSLDIFALNNYIFLPQNSFSLIKAVDGNVSKTADPGDTYTQAQKWAYLNTSIHLPSVMISYQDKMAFAFHMAARAYANAEGVPFHLAKFTYEGLSYKPQQDSNWVSNPFKVTAMGWLETGLTYSAVVSNKHRNYVAIGVTVNYLKGSAAAYLKSDVLNYNVVDRDTVVFSDASVEMAHALPDADGKSASPFTGSGFGADLGITFERKKGYTWRSVYRRSLITPYKTRFGFSIIDIGGITFNKEIGSASISDKSNTWPNINHTKFSNAAGLDSTLNYRFNDAAGSPVSAFRISLPTSVSAQFDYNTNDYIYFNASALFPLTKVGNAVVRKSLISFTPRAETKWTELQIPISFYDFKQVHVGLAFRFHSFFFGSDHILPLLGLEKIYGASIYFGFKISAFKERWSMPDKSMFLPSLKGIFSPFSR